MLVSGVSLKGVYVELHHVALAVSRYLKTRLIPEDTWRNGNVVELIKHSSSWTKCLIAIFSCHVANDLAPCKYPAVNIACCTSPVSAFQNSSRMQLIASEKAGCTLVAAVPWGMAVWRHNKGRDAGKVRWNVFQSHSLGVEVCSNLHESIPGTTCTNTLPILAVP